MNECGWKTQSMIDPMIDLTIKPNDWLEVWWCDNDGYEDDHRNGDTGSAEYFLTSSDVQIYFLC